MIGLAVLLGGCGTDETVSWLEGASYRWDLFNHRVSHLRFEATESGATVAVVGGTSTTGLSTVLDPSCDDATCDEFPFFDEADVAVDVVRLTTSKESVGTGELQLVVGPQGASGTLEVTFGKKARGEGVALLRGYTLDTNVALTGGDACYQPKNGWLPRRLAISLGEVTVADDGMSATVAVDAAFTAGKTFEDERQCLDAVVDQAQVALAVQAVVVVGAESETHTVNQGAEYAYGDGNEPLEQPDPDPVERTVDLGEPDALGWSAIDFRFHQGPGDERGAYVRTLSYLATPDGFVSGHSNNYSPPTQLSGFDYTFEGTVQALHFKGEVAREQLADLIDIDIDDDGAVLPHEL